MTVLTLIVAAASSAMAGESVAPDGFAMFEIEGVTADIRAASIPIRATVVVDGAEEVVDSNCTVEGTGPFLFCPGVAAVRLTVAEFSKDYAVLEGNFGVDDAWLLADVRFLDLREDEDLLVADGLHVYVNWWGREICALGDGTPGSEQDDHDKCDDFCDTIGMGDGSASAHIHQGDCKMMCHCDGLAMGVWYVAPPSDDLGTPVPVER